MNANITSSTPTTKPGRLSTVRRADPQRSQQLWRCAENLIVSTADKLVSQQGKPVDAKFAEDISEAVNTYYERSLQQGTDALNSITQARFLGQVALFCKSQGLLA